jgi:exosortase
LAIDAENVLPAQPASGPERDLGRALAGRAALALGVACVAFAGVAYRGLVGLDPGRRPGELRGVEEMLFEPSGSSPLLIFLGAAWLFARRAPRLHRVLGSPSQPLAALALGLPALALCPWAYYVQVPVLLIPSLSALVLASALWVGGWPAARALLLPALFLLLAVPIPTPLLNQFMYDLQLATAAATARILDAVGLDAVTQAERILHGGQVFQVIESCSGVRTVETLFMSSFLYHDLFYRSRLQSALLVGSSIAIGFVVNQIRVMSIVLNPLSSFAAVHTAQGLVMIVVGVLAIAVVDWVLTRFLAPRPWWRRPRERSAPPPWPRLAVLAAVLALLSAASLGVTPWKPADVRTIPITSLAVHLGPWATGGLKLDREYLGSASFTEFANRRYTRADESVDVLVGADDRTDPHVDFSSPKTALPGSGWLETSRETVRLPSGRRVERIVASAGPRMQLVYFWSEGAASPGNETLRALLALDRSAWRREGRAVAVRISTPLTGSAERAEARLGEVAALVEQEVARILGRGGA